MQVTEVKSEGLAREYKVTIEAAVIDAKVDAEIKKAQGQINMPGFRPGKAPFSLLKKLHGKNMLGQVLEETVNTTSEEVLKDKGVRPAMQPRIEVVSFEEGEDLIYKMDVEVVPVIELPDVKKIKLTRHVVEVNEEQIAEALDNIASQQKNYKKAAKTYKAADGDSVIIDYVGSVNGTEFEGGTAEGAQLVLGSNTFIPGYEEQLVGVKAGDKKDVTVTFPAEYHSKDLSGKEAVFKVVVNEVQKPADVEINDDFAVKLGLENLEKLKEALKDQIANDNSGVSRTQLKRALLDELASLVSFDVPVSMADMEFDQIWAQLKADLLREKQAENADFKEEDLEEIDDKTKGEYRDIALRRVRLGLLLSEIGDKNDVTVAQEEVTRAISEQARRYPGQEKEVFEFYQKDAQAMASIRAPLYEEKVVDYILEQASVTDKSISRDDLIKMIEEEDAEDPKKTTKKKSAAKKTATKKAAAKKTPVKKDGAKKAGTKKAPVKKTATKKKD